MMRNGRRKYIATPYDDLWNLDYKDAEKPKPLEKVKKISTEARKRHSFIY